jgi:hypothetical protein
MSASRSRSTSRIGGSPKSLLYSRVNVELLAEQEAAGLPEPQLLLELQGTHSGYRREVMVEARDAHPELPGYVFDPERPVEVLAEPLQGPCDAVAVAAEDRDLTEPVALLPL